MIEVNENAKEGDLVYAWYSPFKEKANKKPQEHEFRLVRHTKDTLGLVSTNGGYSVVFPKELVETWFGHVRKA